MFFHSASAEPREATNGSATWGVKASFRSYVTGTIAHGQVVLSGGVTDNGSGYTWAISQGSYDSATGEATAKFAGSVRFFGHCTDMSGPCDATRNPALDLTLSNIRVELNGSTGTLYGDAVSKSLATGEMETFTGIAIASLSGATAGGTADNPQWSGISTAIDEAAVVAFSSFYPAGTAMDSLSFNLTLAQAPTPTPTPTATQTSTPSATATATATTPTPTATATTPTPTATATTTVTATATTTATPTSTTAATPIPTTPAPTGTPTATASPSATAVASSTATQTPLPPKTGVGGTNDGGQPTLFVIALVIVTTAMGGLTLAAYRRRR